MPVTEKAQQLFVKSFFANTIPEGLERGRQELGLDALLLNTRQAPPEARHLGAYEIVFGIAPEDAQPVPASLPVCVSRSQAAPSLEQRIEEIRALLTRTRQSSQRRFADSTPEPDSNLEQSLEEAGIEAELARDIANSAAQRMRKRSVPQIGRPRLGSEQDTQTLLSETAAEIESRFQVLPEIGRVTALVGSPGAGKTTALVKLAITQGLAVNRPVRLISIDTQRIGGADQLRSYAAILGVPFQSVECVAALAQAIDAAPPSALVLIDTPGFSTALLGDLAADLAAFLRRRQDIDTHLVLTASMRPADLRTIAEHYAVFCAAKLLFTRLDETSSFAAIFSEAARQQKPLSFFCDGQLVPEDIEGASKERILSSLVHQLPQALKAVA